MNTLCFNRKAPRFGTVSNNKKTAGLLLLPEIRCLFIFNYASSKPMIIPPYSA